MALFPIKDKSIIITGASSGIGEALARCLAKEGAKLALAARRVDRLQALEAEITAAGGEAMAVPTDVRKRDDLSALISLVVKRWGSLDVLVNNAGVSFDEPLIKMDPANVTEELEVNLLAVVACSQLAAKPMLKQRRGHIVNVSSIAGLIGLPGSTVYNAGKWGVVGFSEGLDRELSRFGVRVSAFCPGFVDTDFSARLKKIRETRQGETKLPGVMEVDYVAKKACWLIQHPRRRYVIPPSWNLVVWAARTFPWGADWLLARFLK